MEPAATTSRSAVGRSSAFLPPSLPATLVERPRLRLGLAHGSAWTLVLGAPGSGKTTLVRSWMATSDATWAWITLTPLPYRRFSLAEKIVRAVQGARAAAPLDTVDDIGDAGVDDEALLRHLVEELSLPTATPIVLVVDDSHLLGGDDWALMQQFISQLPPAVHLIVVSRSEPPIPLGRERVTGRLTEVRPDELAFDRVETALLLELVAGPSSESIAVSLHDSTEGWVAGIRLAALAIRDGVSPHGLIDRLVERNATVAEFLVEEVLDKMAPDRRRALALMSLLRLPEPDLCDAVTGRSDSDDILRQLAVDGSFVSPVEGPNGGYRFHKLFATLLQHELESTEPLAARAAHHAAADWLIENDRPVESIEHLLAAGEHERAHELVVGLFRTLYIGAGRRDIDRWLTMVPDDVITESPDRALRHLVALALVAHDDAARWRLYCLDHIPQDDDWLMSRMDAIHALEEIVNGRLGSARESWARSRARRPSDRTEPIDEVIASWDIRLGALLEDPTPAVASARRLQAAPRELVADAPAMSVLAGALAAAGDDASAEAIAERAIDKWRAMGEPALPGMVDALVVAASGARRTGDFDTADDHLAVALAVVPEWAPGPNALTMIPLVERARIAHARRDASWRTQLLGLAEEMRTAGRSAELVDWVDRIRGEMETAVEPASDEVARVAAADAMAESLTEREMTILELLASHLSLAEIGAELYISRHTVKTHVTNIYRKLDASSRSAAIQRARSLQLIV